MQTQGDRPSHMSSGYSKELNVQNVSYFMVSSSCSEKRYSLICLENYSGHALSYTSTKLS